MYLNVLLLSNITLPNGKHIDGAAYAGDIEALHSYDLGHKVHQTRPNDKAWAEWKKCMHLFTHRGSQHTLKEPLGAWTVPPHEYTRQWVLLYSATEDAIFQHTAVDYSVHRRLNYDYDKDTEEFQQDLPQDAVPIELKETPHTWIKPRHIAPQDLTPDPDHPESFAVLLGALPPWEHFLLQDIVFIQKEDEIWAALCQGTCFAASDGSASKDRGALRRPLCPLQRTRVWTCNLLLSSRSIRHPIYTPVLPPNGLHSLEIR